MLSLPSFVVPRSWNSPTSSPCCTASTRSSLPRWPAWTPCLWAVRMPPPRRRLPSTPSPRFARPCRHPKSNTLPDKSRTSFSFQKTAQMSTGLQVVVNKSMRTYHKNISSMIPVLVLILVQDQRDQNLSKDQAEQGTV